jgi:adenine phosphoribosyltransferase
MDLKKIIRTIPDFPKPGIQFKDITPLLAHPAAFDYAISQLSNTFKALNVDHIVGMESRGFIFGAAVARELKAGFVPVRKPHKLPYKTFEVEYALEYGTNILQIHQDALPEGARVGIIDDLLATGGTAHAAVQLVEKLEANVVGLGFVIELIALNGRKKFPSANIYSLVQY